MSIWDDRILEYIQKYDSATPKELKDSGLIRVSKSHISRRCQRLVEHGMLKHLGNGVYVITDRGEAYLAGDLDASEDAQDEPVDVGEGETSSSETEESQ